MTAPIRIERKLGGHVFALTINPDAINPGPRYTHVTLTAIDGVTVTKEAFGLALKLVERAAQEPPGRAGR